MKFLHTSDLHIGKKLFDVSLLEEQQNALRQIRDLAVEEQVDAVLIAGDIYDRAVPPTDAVELLDEFLTDLVECKIPVILITGNHDCGERVAFADRILERQGIYIAGDSAEAPKEIVLEDEWGSVSFVCLPFVKPAQAGAADSAGTVEKLLEAFGQPKENRAVLVTHYFVIGEKGEQPQLSESESTVNVGGLDHVPAGLFSAFSYTALGHIHKSQRVGGGEVYYSGSPVKYSFSEALTTKTVNLVSMDSAGEITVEYRSLEPVHEMRCIRGKLQDLLTAAGEGSEDYLQVTLTDTEELIDPMGTLRSVYPNILQIIMEKHLADAQEGYISRLTGERKETRLLFADFYELVTGDAMDEIRMRYVEEAVKEAEGR